MICTIYNSWEVYNLSIEQLDIFLNFPIISMWNLEKLILILNFGREMISVVNSHQFFFITRDNCRHFDWWRHNSKLHAKIKNFTFDRFGMNSTSANSFHEKIEGSHAKFLFLLQNPQTKLKNLILSGVIDSLKIVLRFSIFEQKMLASATLRTLKLAATFFEKLS